MIHYQTLCSWISSFQNSEENMFLLTTSYPVCGVVFYQHEMDCDTSQGLSLCHYDWHWMCTKCNRKQNRIKPPPLQCVCIRDTSYFKGVLENQGEAIEKRPKTSMWETLGDMWPPSRCKVLCRPTAPTPTHPFFLNISWVCPVWRMANRINRIGARGLEMTIWLFWVSQKNIHHTPPLPWVLRDWGHREQNILHAWLCGASILIGKTFPEQSSYVRPPCGTKNCKGSRERKAEAAKR
jgi:hypothetical protein